MIPKNVKFLYYSKYDGTSDVALAELDYLLEKKVYDVYRQSVYLEEKIKLEHKLL